MFCGPCVDSFKGAGPTAFLRALLFGGGAALLGTIAWYAIKITDSEFGLLGIVVGLFVGVAVRKGARGLGGWKYQALAMVLTYLSITTSYVPILIKAAADAAAQDKKEAATEALGSAAAPKAGPDEQAQEGAPAAARPTPGFRVTTVGRWRGAGAAGRVRGGAGAAVSRRRQQFHGLDHHRHRTLRGVEAQSACADLGSVPIQRRLSVPAPAPVTRMPRRLPRRERPIDPRRRLPSASASAAAASSRRRSLPAPAAGSWCSPRAEATGGRGRERRAGRAPVRARWSRGGRRWRCCRRRLGAAPARAGQGAGAERAGAARCDAGRAAAARRPGRARATGAGAAAAAFALGEVGGGRGRARHPAAEVQVGAAVPAQQGEGAAHRPDAGEDVPVDGARGRRLHDDLGLAVRARHRRSRSTCTRWATSCGCAATGFRRRRRCSSPGLGAFVRLKQHPPPSARTRASAWRGRCGARPRRSSRWCSVSRCDRPIFVAIARVGAWINLFNLLPVWQLDGGRGFAALSRRQRGHVAALFWVLALAGKDGAVLPRASRRRSAPLRPARRPSRVTGTSC